MRRAAQVVRVRPDQRERYRAPHRDAPRPVPDPARTAAGEATRAWWRPTEQVSVMP